jgi:DNA damage-inducible protein 1
MAQLTLRIRSPTVDDLVFKQTIVDNNYQLAMDTMPEMFIPVNMLYIRGKMNNTDLDIFVDTGAQVSVMSLSMTKELGVDYLIDHSYDGVVVGLGTKKIIGKIHYLDIQLENFNLPCRFTIIDDDDIKIILGLNSMLSLGCIIDLKNKKMVFNDYEVKFLCY